jgi:hypothetical protein
MDYSGPDPHYDNEGNIQTAHGSMFSQMWSMQWGSEPPNDLEFPADEDPSYSSEQMVDFDVEGEVNFDVEGEVNFVDLSLESTSGFSGLPGYGPSATSHGVDTESFEDLEAFETQATTTPHQRFNEPNPGHPYLDAKSMPVTADTEAPAAIGGWVEQVPPVTAYHQGYAPGTEKHIQHVGGHQHNSGNEYTYEYNAPAAPALYAAGVKHVPPHWAEPEMRPYGQKPARRHDTIMPNRDNGESQYSPLWNFLDRQGPVNTTAARPCCSCPDTASQVPYNPSGSVSTMPYTRASASSSDSGRHNLSGSMITIRPASGLRLLEDQPRCPHGNIRYIARSTEHEDVLGTSVRSSQLRTHLRYAEQGSRSVFLLLLYLG